MPVESKTLTPEGREIFQEMLREGETGRETLWRAIFTIKTVAGSVAPSGELGNTHRGTDLLANETIGYLQGRKGQTFLAKKAEADFKRGARQVIEGLTSPDVVRGYTDEKGTKMHPSRLAKKEFISRDGYSKDGSLTIDRWDPFVLGQRWGLGYMLRLVAEHQKASQK